MPRFTREVVGGPAHPRPVIWSTRPYVDSYKGEIFTWCGRNREWGICLKGGEGGGKVGGRRAAHFHEVRMIYRVFRSGWCKQGERFVLLFLILVACSVGLGTGRLIAVEATNSIVDQAIASKEFRLQLIAEYEKAPTTFIDDRLLAVGASYALVSNYPVAQSIYDKILVAHPENARALRGRAQIAFLQGRLMEAIPYAEKALKLGDTSSLGGLAGFYFDTGQFEKVDQLLPELRKHASEGLIANQILSIAVNREPMDSSLFLESLRAKPLKQLLAKENTDSMIKHGLD